MMIALLQLKCTVIHCTFFCPNSLLRLAHVGAFEQAGVLKYGQHYSVPILSTPTIAFTLNATLQFLRDSVLCKLLHFALALALTAGLTCRSHSWCLAWKGHLETSKYSCSLRSTCCYRSNKTLVSKLKIKSGENRIAIESKFYLVVFFVYARSNHVPVCLSRQKIKHSNCVLYQFSFNRMVFTPFFRHNLTGCPTLIRFALVNTR